MRALAALFSAALVLSALRSFANERALAVAEYGRPDRISVRGTTAFTEAEIVCELFADIDVANATYPTAPLEELQQRLAEKTRAGYRHAGFAEATVESSLDEKANKVVLTVVEGPRYLASDVEISGLPAADATWLREKFIAPTATDDGDSPVAEASNSPLNNSQRSFRWPVGQPAWCDTETQIWYQRKIEDLWFDRGFLFPDFTVRVRLDQVRRQAILAIDFVDRGRAAKLDDIVITGNQRNSRDDILAFLKLTSGMDVHGELSKEIADKLAQSGRFIKSKLKLRKPQVSGERLTMTIELTEYAKAPLLRDPLTREEAALVKLSQWLCAFDNGDEEILVRFKAPAAVIEIVASPRLGVVAMVRETAEDKWQPRTPFTVALAVANDRLGIYSAKRRRQFSTAGLPSRVMAHVQVTMHDDPPKLNAQGRIKFGFSARTRSPYPRPIRLLLNTSTVAMLALAHEYGAQMSWNENVLTVTYAGRALEFDSTSGRLLSARGGGWDNVAMEIVHADGEFERRVRQIDDAIGGYPNDVDLQHPLTSALAFASQELLADLKAKDQEPVKLVHRLATLGLLHPLDEALVAYHAAKSDFTVPFGDDLRNLADEPRARFQVAAGYIANRVASRLFPRGSWSDRLAREAVFAAVGKSRHLNEELYYTPADVGPLWHLSSAAVAQLAGTNGAAARCAREGMRHMSPQEFKYDCAGLCDSGTFIGKSVTNTARVLGQLNASEAALLCRALVAAHLIKEEHRDDLAACFTHLREHAGDLPAADADAALDSLWQLAIKDRVGWALRKLAGSTRRTSTDVPQTAAPTPDNTKGSTADKVDGDSLYKPILPFGPARKPNGKNALGTQR